MFEQNLQTLVTYAIALVVPLLFLSFRLLSSKSKAPPPPEEEPNKPLKPIMQSANADLAPPKDDPYTPEQLAEYDGKDSSKPILVAIKGDIFDVTRKADVYGPGRSYNVFAGKDGSKGLGMSSLKAEHAISDYSELNESDMKVLNEWHDFFSKRYNIVGKVVPSNTPSANM